MNSGKVRIYELSKELNLDNKDILAICDRLDIAVKSHSSTIAESEAEQIRSAAQSARQPQSSNRPDRPRPNLLKNGSRPEKKQQILEIRRHRITPKSEREVDSQAPVSSPPQRPTTEVEGAAVSPRARSWNLPSPSQPLFPSVLADLSLFPQKIQT
jgi:translation initiation factor IF-2